MDRAESIRRLRERKPPWDLLVIGGGATGVGCALDAAARGHEVALLEQADFGKGTSSRSTKLIHGGVRYLKQGRIGLVKEALAERERLRRNAAGFVRERGFVIPLRSRWEGAFYAAGLAVYDLLAGTTGFPKSRRLSREETLVLAPTLRRDGLRGGVLYFDGQFDDAQFLIALAKAASKRGAALANYARADSMLKDGSGRTCGVRATDLETGEELEVRARVVVNAAGPFGDAIRVLDDPGARPSLRPSSGAHLVFEKRWLPGETAVLVPKTPDGRVLFAIPWHGHVLLGTTDVAAASSLEPRASDAETEQLLESAHRLFEEAPGAADVKSVFAGLRPLAADGAGATAKLSRDFTISVSPSGLVSLAGGKWTTYRRMAEAAVDRAESAGGLTPRPCATRTLAIEGSAREEGERLESLVRRAAREEMARRVEDVLARRSRLLFLDARAALETAPRVAGLLASELGRDDAWTVSETRDFAELARGYLLTSPPP